MTFLLVNTGYASITWFHKAYLIILPALLLNTIYVYLFLYSAVMSGTISFQPKTFKGNHEVQNRLMRKSLYE